MISDRYYLGVDGGGTKCRARLRAADGTLLGEGLGGPANIRLGLDRAWASIMEAIQAALAQAGLDAAVFPRLHVGLGLAGIVTAADSVRTRAAAPRFASVSAETDAHAACLGAFSGRDGAILIAGTGSAGYALINGQGHAVGGWGFEVSDEGSGASIGREAIRVALRAHDNLAPETGLTRQIRQRLGGSPAAIVAWVNDAGPADYGRLVPDVLAHAAKGDVVACTIIAKAAKELETYIRHLHALGAPHLCLMGGLSAPLTPWLSPWARSLLAAPEGDALEGALLMARLNIPSPIAKSALP
ncbi:BadF/BadG/BcrA/BcrD ATPase family protein [Nitrospirillum amazonense]|uniref:BadF/BadG/BcrA/BcrD ATPase family protein n=1 Tax=Nitrospirillum amazonense TaxID=28077 RepID=UPI002DD42CDB|nr:BadF/BadG/BcrA/BcrD ATPase family protein [Nitrospirillum amazonense]MEC4590245.1 BadF/BadG/BcrA/BcrD ATPase family protein [Nitrospirillum amazonense]